MNVRSALLLALALGLGAQLAYGRRHAGQRRVEQARSRHVVEARQRHVVGCSQPGGLEPDIQPYPGPGTGLAVDEPDFGSCQVINFVNFLRVSRLDHKTKAAMRQGGFLTRDAREKERKKAGLKRARKAPQYTKR